MNKPQSPMGMKDPQGHILIPPRVHDVLRHKPVWAVYKLSREIHPIAIPQSDPSDLLTAKATLDMLNANRGVDHYFKVYRVAVAD